MADAPVALTQQAARRTAAATRQTLQRIPDLGDMGRRVPPSSKPRLFVVVESPWFTDTQIGGSGGLGTVVAAVRLPIVAAGAKLDIPTGVQSTALFTSAYVTERDSGGFPTKAVVSIGGDSETLDVTKLYCGPLAGRPFRSQIICAVPADGKWWLTGTINPSLFGVVKDIGSPQLVTVTDFQGDPVAPADPEYSDNMDLPVSDSLQLAEGVDYQVGDLVILTWIGAGYYVTWIQCQEVV